MIDQIYTFFTLQMVYLWLNLGVLPFWFVLVVFPKSHICKVFITSIFPIFILSLFYTYLLYVAKIEGYDFLQNFKLYLGFSEINNLFDEMYSSNGYTWGFIDGDRVTENWLYPQAGTNFLAGVTVKF